jgi:hypothetical protein
MKLSDGMNDLGKKKNESCIEYYEYDTETRLKPEVIYSKIFDPDTDET